MRRTTIVAAAANSPGYCFLRKVFNEYTSVRGRAGFDRPRGNTF